MKACPRPRSARRRGDRLGRRAARLCGGRGGARARLPPRAAGRSGGAARLRGRSTPGPRPPEPPAGVDRSAGSVVRLRPFSRRERRDFALWAGPVALRRRPVLRRSHGSDHPGISAGDQAGLARGRARPAAGLACARRPVADVSASRAARGRRRSRRSARPCAGAALRSRCRGWLFALLARRSRSVPGGRSPPCPGVIRPAVDRGWACSAPRRRGRRPRRQTRLRRDLETETVAGRVVAVLSDVRIASRVSRATSSSGAAASRFGSGGLVEGNLSVFGGTIDAPEGGPLPVSGIGLDAGHAPAPLSGRDAPGAVGGECPPAPAFSRGLRLVALSVWLAVRLRSPLSLRFAFPRAAAPRRDPLDGHAARRRARRAEPPAATAALALPSAGLSVPIAIFLRRGRGGGEGLRNGRALSAARTEARSRMFRPRDARWRSRSGSRCSGPSRSFPSSGLVVWSVASVVAVGSRLPDRASARRAIAVAAGLKPCRASFDSAVPRQ